MTASILSPESAIEYVRNHFRLAIVGDIRVIDAVEHFEDEIRTIKVKFNLPSTDRVDTFTVWIESYPGRDPYLYGEW